MPLERLHHGLYLIAGVLLGLVGAFLIVPTLRRWLATAVRPRLKEVFGDLAELAREPKRLAIIVLGCAATTLRRLPCWSNSSTLGCPWTKQGSLPTFMNETPPATDPPAPCQLPCALRLLA